MSNFVKPPNPDSDSDEIDTHNNTALHIPKQRFGTIRKFPMGTGEKERFFQLLNHLKDTHKKFPERSISTFGCRNHSFLQNDLDIR